MKRITLIILAIIAILFGSVSCQKDPMPAPAEEPLNSSMLWRTARNWITRTTVKKTLDTLYIMDTEEDRYEAIHMALSLVPYERNSIENYYCNPEAYATFNTDRWQLEFSNKTRVQRMMTYYWPVMSEVQALRCLQQGNFGMELASPQVTDWSCVYNPKQGTLLFNMRDDLSEVYYLNVYRCFFTKFSSS